LIAALEDVDARLFTAMRGGVRRGWGWWDARMIAGLLGRQDGLCFFHAG